MSETTFIRAVVVLTLLTAIVSVAASVVRAEERQAMQKRLCPLVNARLREAISMDDAASVSEIIALANEPLCRGFSNGR